MTFLETPPALKCLEMGLKLFNLRIPRHNIKEEEYISIQTCMRCYKVEDHNTSDCPKDKEYNICSGCGTEGHVWQSCKSSAKSRINCSGEHRPIAHKCSIRKAATQSQRGHESGENSVLCIRSLYVHDHAHTYSAPQLIACQQDRVVHLPCLGCRSRQPRLLRE